MRYGKQKIQTLETNFDSYVNSGNQENIWVPFSLVERKDAFGRADELQDPKGTCSGCGRSFSILEICIEVEDSYSDNHLEGNDPKKETAYMLLEYSLATLISKCVPVFHVQNKAPSTAKVSFSEAASPRPVVTRCYDTLRVVTGSQAAIFLCGFIPTFQCWV
ncbi:hypothetical protein MG293_017349 [Ovis ammon polii]|uniref:Uncharacterized protein n=1 Tax=Ovis ammon polii TaxID=230172 RepID=A0AAD4TTP4_OVIAM|nr:hypothetical protein MG293_017349 [Ovis ammon polii]